MILLLLALGCDDHVRRVRRGGDEDCDRDPPLTYETFGAGRMEELCTACHSSLFEGYDRRNGAPEGVDLDTLAGVVEHYDRVVARTVDGRTMPAGGNVTEEDLAMIEEWLVCEVADLSLGAR